MGYYTTFSMTFEKPDGQEDRPSCNHLPPKMAKFCPECGKAVGVQGLPNSIASYISKRREEGGTEFYGINPDGSSYGKVKWYKWESDMRGLSREFPGVLFKLHGEGEENGDVWDAYFLDGKFQKCMAEIVIPPFDQSKLK